MNEGFQSALAGARRVAEILELQPEVADPPSGAQPAQVQGQVALRNIEFSYLPEFPVLKDISIEIKPGQILALVGPTGAGKSTITSLVGRFYDPQRGCLLIDGIDARDMKLATLRRNMSMVLQDVFLFNGTVRDNIRFGKPDASDNEIIRAAQVARAHEFIMALPNGYDTEIGERGIKLSGGQKQRLAIARAVLKDAPILILDEATSSVDTQTEAEIQEALAELMRGRTSIVVAHRLSTIKNADMIAVISEGQIVERGQHEDLIERSGLYCQLYEKQLKKEELHLLAAS
jgi:ATP-binding cassette subfamily B protein